MDGENKDVDKINSGDANVVSLSEATVEPVAKE